MPLPLPLKNSIFTPLIFSILLIFLIGCKPSDSKAEFMPGTPEYRGKKLFYDMACNACHSENGSLKIGPTMKGQYGKEIRHIDGSVMIIDDEYIRQSLIKPLQYIAEGYTPIMPSYKPVLKDEDIENLIAYIKALK